MADRRRQEIVLVSGAPGSGKTTLAVPLAERLGFALIAKDEIKETMFGALGGVPGDMTESQRHGAAAMEVLWTLMRRCPQAVLESNFRREFALPRLRGLDASIVEVHCSCTPDVLVERITGRASSRHAAHRDIARLREFDDGQAVLDAHGPVGMGALVAVDTTTPVDLDLLVRDVDALLVELRV